MGKGKFEKKSNGGNTMNYKKMSIEDITAWCVANNQVEWLKETAAKLVPYEIYPRKKVLKYDENGNQVFTKKGKPAYSWEADKDAKPEIEMRPISFVQIKSAFCEKFEKELNFPKKEKKLSMHQLIKEL